MSSLGNKNENIHQFIIDEEYARLRARQKLAEPIGIIEEASTANSQNPITVDLKRLFEEKAALLNEKDQLVRAKEVLNHRITEVIENKRTRIQQLKTEILELRARMRNSRKRN